MTKQPTSREELHGPGTATKSKNTGIPGKRSNMSKNNPTTVPIEKEDLVWATDFGRPYQAVVLDIKKDLFGHKYLLEEPLEGIDLGFDFTRTKWRRAWRVWK